MEIEEGTWSYSVANDPRHRPQSLDRPATTVRREWSRWPQEAHLVDEEARRYRRLTVDEIAAIQGFEPNWVKAPGLSERDQIAALGNAVPPALAAAIGTAISKCWKFDDTRSVEICAGIGGLSFASKAAGLSPCALIEIWPPACEILKHEKPWSSSVVLCTDAMEVDYARFKGAGMLLGGPPCQPWSHGGKGKGALDPRDLLGHIPELLEQCEPEVFLFENVPGLYSSATHREYLEDLVYRLGSPSESLSYGVALGIFTAADFGVPQVRRRLFLIGFRDRSAAFATRVLQMVSSSASHADPALVAAGKKKWVTLREAFTSLGESGGWKRLPTKEKLVTDIANVDEVFRRPAGTIEFTWPGKGDLPQVVGRRWEIRPPSKGRQYRPLLRCEPESAPGVETAAAVAIYGDVIDCLDALKPLASGRLDLVYHESYRVDVLEKESKYPNYRNSTWLSMLREWCSRARHTLKLGGFYALQVDDNSYHYARLCLDEEFGHLNYVCTIVWQKKYGPQNDLNVPTAAQEYIIVYSTAPAESLPVMGFQVADDLIDDGDPRGAWVAGHKGAKSGSDDSKFEVNAPPYRWQLISGELPPGIWRLNPLSGVIWGEKVVSSGTFPINVRVTDAAGNTAESKITIEIQPEGRSNASQIVPWLFKEPRGQKTAGRLRISSPDKIVGTVGREFSTILLAEGGTPFTFGTKKGMPGQGRYWEFSRKTLESAVLKDDVSFGSKGTALPSVKKHHTPEGRTARIITWWNYEDYGKSEDASRHLNELRDQGLIPRAALVGKPERLMLRLLELLAPLPNSRVLCIGDQAASMASVCVKTGRKPLSLAGNSVSAEETWSECGLPRLKAVLSGKDTGGISPQLSGEVRTGDLLELEAGATVFNQDIEDRSLNPNISSYPLDSDRLLEALASLAGYVTDPTSSELAKNLDGETCVVLPPDNVLGGESLAYFEEQGRSAPLTILFESTSVDDEHISASSVRLLRYPEDLVSR